MARSQIDTIPEVRAALLDALGNGANLVQATAAIAGMTQPPLSRFAVLRWTEKPENRIAIAARRTIKPMPSEILRPKETKTKVKTRGRVTPLDAVELVNLANVGIREAIRILTEIAADTGYPGDLRKEAAECLGVMSTLVRESVMFDLEVTQST